MAALLFFRCQLPSDPYNRKNAYEVNYPETREDSTEDNYHGTTVSDPFRWLEDDHSAETKAWVGLQNTVTNEYLSQIPFRTLIKDRLTELWNFERYGAPFKRGDKYYYFHNDGLQNQSVLYVQDDLGAARKVALDPNTFSSDGTIALSSIAFNKVGDKLAYITSSAGSDWSQVNVLDLKTSKTLPDVIHWVKFSSVAWHGDGFYYSRFPEPDSVSALSGENKFHKVYYHGLGDPQEQDRLVMENKNEPKRLLYAGTTEDERFLYISEGESSDGNALHVKDLTTDGPFFTIFESFAFDNDVIGSLESKILVRSTDSAQNGRLLSIDLSSPDEKVELIPEEKDVLADVHLIGGNIVTTYLEEAKSVVRIYDEQGKNERVLKLPGIGTVSTITGRKEDQEAFFSFASYTVPSTIYQVKMDDLQPKIFKKPELAFDMTTYETKQVFYTSADGTEVPMFITHRRGLELDGKNPTLLYGYGGFNISLTPGFSVTNLILLENGGIFVVPNIRGGGEYGKEWHKAGTRDQKQNVFDDFIAAAEYLIDQKYTSSDKLGIMGGSNGGLLVGACMTQRPDLFKVVVPRVGVLDMLRYHKFTIGWAWADDYGSSDDPEAFKYLIEYSPLHNIEEVAYPATFVMTADHDDRVVPAHSFKFIATLQKKHQGGAPVLIRIEESAGHGAGKPTSKLIEESTDMMSFVLYNLDEDIHEK
ncbi:MAG: S9 family peptidase [Saprospiraceae bacterium]|nr:S9 family peptidase [Saprospiraceae bacterium]